MSSSSGTRQRATVQVAQLVPQNNRTKYLVYALEGTRAHDPFLNRLFRALPLRGASRADLNAMVAEAGRGKYRIYYNSVVVDHGDAHKKLRF